MVESAATRHKTVTNPQESVRVHVHWIMKVIFAVGFIAYSRDTYASWRQGVPIEGLASGLGALIIAWAFLLAGTKIDVDQQGIRLTAPHGVYELRWDDIRLVEIKGNASRFFGDSKALTFYLLLAGKGKREFQEYVTRSVEERQIPAGRPPHLNFFKLMRMQSNAKVHGWKLF